MSTYKIEKQYFANVTPHHEIVGNMTELLQNVANGRPQV